MLKQYAISFNDRMNTYGVAKTHDAFYIEGITGIINAEIDRGAKFVECVYVDQRPSILIFEKDDGRQARPPANQLSPREPR